MSTALDHFAARVSNDPAFLAYQLAAYARCHDLNDAALANLLGVTPDMLTRLRLCGALVGDGVAEDVRRIAERFGCDAGALAGIVGAKGNS